MGWALLPTIIAAASSAAQAGSSIAGAAGRSSPPRKHTVPLPPYIDALQRMTARYLAQNMTAQPMSFADYIAGGAKGGFGTQPALVSPVEAAGVGLTGRFGQAIPFLDPTTGLPTPGPGALSPEQALYLADAYRQMGKPGAARKVRRKLFAREDQAAQSNRGQTSVKPKRSS